ncbi:hypothetical protein BB558_003983 [Smittium angustum]|uniref:TATA-binding protein interacting (TIP20) domain-containing protein n=1 Tax=Smittium angustum TaxID=133377 RepID=A0A2U1J4P3_SMIAN|nr:hypothetical protein BB558_003983 [Smittium angustum]
MTSLNQNEILKQLESEDRDFRYMAVLDLTKLIEAQNDWLLLENYELRIFNALVKLLNDPLSEVQNLAINCLGSFSTRAGDTSVINFISTAINTAFSAKTPEQRIVFCAAIKKMIVEASKIESKQSKIEETILPKVIQNLEKINLGKDDILEALGILEVILKCSAKSKPLKNQTGVSISNLIIKILESNQSILWRQAISIVSEVSKKLDRINSSARQLSAAVDLDEHILIPTMLSYLNDESTITKTSSLQILEVIIEKSTLVKPKDIDLIYSSSKELLKYDPNYLNIDEEYSDDEFDFDDEDQFEQDYSDEDDSWKVRTASIRLMGALARRLLSISNSSLKSLNFSVYDICNQLVERFSDHEDMVRGVSLFEITRTLPLIKNSNSSSTHINSLAQYAFSQLKVSCSDKKSSRSMETMKNELLVYTCLIDLTPEIASKSINDFIYSILTAIDQKSVLSITNKSVPSESWTYPAGLEIETINILNTIYKHNVILYNFENMNPETFEKKTGNLLLPTIKSLKSALNNKLNSIIEASVEVSHEIFINFNKNKSLNPKVFDLQFKNISEGLITIVSSINEIIQRGSDVDQSKKCLKVYGAITEFFGLSISENIPREFINIILEKTLTKDSLRASGIQALSDIINSSFGGALISKCQISELIITKLIESVGLKNTQGSGLAIKCLISYTKNCILHDPTIAKKINADNTFILVVYKFFENTSETDRIPDAIHLLETIIPILKPSQIFDVITSLLVKLILDLNSKQIDTEDIELQLSNFFVSVGTSCQYSLHEEILTKLLDVFSALKPDLNTKNIISISSTCISALAISSKESSTLIQKQVEQVIKNYKKNYILSAIYIRVGGSLCINYTTCSFKNLIVSFISNQVGNPLYDIFDNASTNNSSKQLISESISYSIAYAAIMDQELLKMTILCFTKTGNKPKMPETTNGIFIQALQILTRSLSVPGTICHGIPESQEMISNMCKNVDRLSILDAVITKASGMDKRNENDYEKSLEIAKIISSLFLFDTETTAKYILKVFASITMRLEMVKSTIISSARTCIDKLVLYERIPLSFDILGRDYSSESDLVGTVVNKCFYMLNDVSPLVSVGSLNLIKSYVTHLATYEKSNAGNKDVFDNENVILQKLSEILAGLFELTKTRTDLIKIEKIGPFQHKVDSGLEMRKTAFEVLIHISCYWRNQIINCGTMEIAGSGDEMCVDSGKVADEKQVNTIADAVVTGLQDDEHSVYILACDLLISLCSGEGSKSFDGTQLKKSDEKANSDLFACLEEKIELVSESIKKLFLTKIKPSDSKQYIDLLESAKQSSALLLANIKNLASKHKTTKHTTQILISLQDIISSYPDKTLFVLYTQSLEN